MNGPVIELVDLVDKTGQIQKRQVPRHEATKHPELHMQIIIAVAFDGQGRLLVHRRALTKDVNPGHIDHVCGAIASGESPEEAAAREAREETGVELDGLRIVTYGINEYNRYRYLLAGEAKSEPSIVNPEEVMWAGYLHPEELHNKHTSGELGFVDGFFEDINLVNLHRST